MSLRSCWLVMFRGEDGEWQFSIDIYRKFNRYSKALAELNKQKPDWRELGYKIFRFDCNLPD